MNTGKVWCGILLSAALALSVAPAHAQSEAQKKQQAKEHYERATRLFDLSRYDEAIQEYEATYLLVPDPNQLFNMGQAYRLWDKPEEAIRCYKNYLRNRADAPNRADVEKRIAELERTVEERHRSAAVPSATAQAPGPAPPPGPAPSPAAEPAPGMGTAATAETAPHRAAGTVVQPGPSWLDKHGRVAAYAAFSAGGACLLTSLVTGLIARSKGNQLADDSKKPNHPVFDPSVQSSGKTLNSVAIVTGLTGLALGGAGLYLYLRSGRASRMAPATPSTEVALFPLAGPGFAGAIANVAF